MPRIDALRAAATVAAASLLGGCSSFDFSTDALLGMVSPYRIDIQQGNVVTSEQMARLKVGMTRLQVRETVGTPLLSDPFHLDRWDYIFTLVQPGKPAMRRDITLYFDGDRLTKIEAPELPDERAFISSIARRPVPSEARNLELSEAQVKALPIPPSVPPPPANPAAPLPPRNYPPLEPS